jgi:hypothetical protein
MKYSKDEAINRLDGLFPYGAPRRGIPYDSVGLNLGYGKKHSEVKSMPITPEKFIQHSIHGLFVHHEKMNISRVKWHIEHCEDLFNNVRPMLLSIENGNKYIIDGCHRTVALILFGVKSFPYATWEFE